MNTPQTYRAHAYVAGRVQGVWFRQTTADRARELGVGGWVRNLPDGRVELLAEGSRDQIEALLEFTRVGPPLARVQAVDAEWEAATGDFSDFKVR